LRPVERWCRYIEEEERFWGICLEVARSKPHLCAEEVEAEAVDIMNCLNPRPDERLYYVVIQACLDNYLRFSVS